MKTIGEKILALRKEQNLNQKQLADMAKITEATLSRYEHNQREPRGQIVTRIAKVLNVSTDYLLNDEDSSYTNNEDIFHFEEEASRFLDAIDNKKDFRFCGSDADGDDREYLKDAFKKFLLDIRIYSQKKRQLQNEE